MKKNCLILLFLFSATYSQDCLINKEGLTLCEKKLEKAFITVEVEKIVREKGSACFPYGDGYSFPDLTLKIAIDGNLIVFPREMYCIFAMVNDLTVERKKNGFVMFGSSGDASETVFFELFFDKEKVYKSLIFDREDKRDTVSISVYKPVLYE